MLFSSVVVLSMHQRNSQIASPIFFLCPFCRSPEYTGKGQLFFGVSLVIVMSYCNVSVISPSFLLQSCIEELGK